MFVGKTKYYFVLDFMNRLISHHIIRPFLFKNFLQIHIPPSSLILKRFLSSTNKNDFEEAFKKFERNEKNRRVDIALYMSSMAILMLGLTYASVPLYKMFCEATGFDGIIRKNEDEETVSANVRQLSQRIDKSHPLLRINFSSTPSSLLPWTFEPEQPDIYIKPGETALAFYRAKNESNRPIIGIATYNVQPSQAAFYFNKIQCFCFEEQRLEPGEEIDMPVFFYIDPDFIRDPSLQGVHDISLSYTFFESKGTEHLALMGGDPTIAHIKLKPSEALPYAHRHNEKMITAAS
jgi:cytochrome c oxidase assembly protein subunit 11